MRKYLILLSLLAGACAVRAQGTSNAVRPAAPMVATAAAEGSLDLDDKHVLAPGDKLSFSILEDKDPPNTPPKPLTVTDSRELDVPYIGRVSVKDQTCRQVAGELKKLLEKDYYYTATVRLGLDQVNKLRGKVYIEGYVRTQGSIDLVFDEKMTAGNAIMKAGGFADFANKSKVKVFRTPPTPGEPLVVIPVDMEKVFTGIGGEKDVVLEPGDIIRVPARAFNLK